MGMDGGVRLDSLEAAATIDAAALDNARFGFHRVHPHRSAKRRLYVTQALVILALIAALTWAVASAPALTFNIAHYVAVGFFACAIAWRLAAASNLAPLLSRISDREDVPVYTILCPIYREANVVADLVASLERLEYPKEKLQIQLLVEGDDPDTVAAALAASAAPHIEVVVIPACAPRTKPKALNIGLARARGEFVVVYDAEDRPSQYQLRAALAAFENGGERLACVQAPLRIDNANVSWIADQFAAEYAIQFREMLPFLARLGLPLPLGGTSNHFRTDILRKIGGWDAYNVTEDADLGYRLARDGWRADVIGPPTDEEAPITVRAWLHQRTRWIKGHLQTWLVLMRNPFRTAREMGLGAFVSMQLVFGGGLIAAFVHGPLAFIVLTAMFSHFNLTAIDFALAVAGYCVAVFAALTASALSNNLTHARAALTMPLYWPLSTLAAFCAAGELLVRPHHWSKTAHGVSPRERHSFSVLPIRSDQSDASNRHMASMSASL
jgi:cellulose synthase/poly-beta-1,6-N-acetylglucosamine synthase-like glycosyltransferase